MLTTGRAADELLTEIEVPALAEGTCCAFEEHARTHGDWALSGAAVVAAPEAGVAICLLAAGPAPRRAREAEAALHDGADPAEAAALAAAGIDDEYRRALAGELTRRVLERALA
jgi:carbon-monoxide dehydrogenase medium subunit/6-hydroxypseudooxynicotine dehydrogenase subunit alpha